MHKNQNWKWILDVIVWQIWAQKNFYKSISVNTVCCASLTYWLMQSSQTRDRFRWTETKRKKVCGQTKQTLIFFPEAVNVTLLLLKRSRTFNLLWAQFKSLPHWRRGGALVSLASAPCTSGSTPSCRKVKTDFKTMCAFIQQNIWQGRPRAVEQLESCTWHYKKKSSVPRHLQTVRSKERGKHGTVDTFCYMMKFKITLFPPKRK